jgi:hypothetical protein
MKIKTKIFQCLCVSIDGARRSENALWAPESMQFFGLSFSTIHEKLDSSDSIKWLYTFFLSRCFWNWHNPWHSILRTQSFAGHSLSLKIQFWYFPLYDFRQITLNHTFLWVKQGWKSYLLSSSWSKMRYHVQSTYYNV